MTLAATMAAVALAMPSPSPMPTIHENTPCPDMPSAEFNTVFGCYYPGGDIYLSPGIVGSSPWVREHELAHAVHHLHFDQGERNRVMTVLGWKRWRVEPAADIYAGCRLGLDPRDPSTRAGRVFVGVKAKRVPMVCRLMARAASRDSASRGSVASSATAP